MLLVEDDPSALHLLERFVEKEGFEVRTSANAEEAERLALDYRPHLVIADVVLTGKDGFTLLSRLKETLPETEVILLTGHASVDRAVEAIREGACDYLEKPIDRSRLIASVRRTRQQVALRLENMELRSRLTTHVREMLVGQSPAIEKIRRTIEQVAGGDMNVFIEGESGTGKEVAAEMLHHLGIRSRGPLIKVSCAAIPETLLESEMFGHEKGAFTGAAQSRAGKFELADGGTLFLDEVGEMTSSLQAKLLRVLQDGRFTRLGSNEVRTADVRVVAATNVNVAQAVSSGKFREDLLYRLNVIHLRMPPLRERAEDIPFLVTHFLAALRKRLKVEELPVAPAAMKLLQNHSWPGNVRELINTLERAVSLRRGPLLDVQDFVLAPTAVAATGPSSTRGLLFELGTPLEQVEKQMIRAAMEASGGSKERAAAMLGISTRTIYRKLGEG